MFKHFLIILRITPRDIANFFKAAGRFFRDRGFVFLVFAAVCLCSVSVPVFADFGTSDIVDTQFSNWEQLPDDYKALGEAYIKFLKSDSLNSIFKNASEIPLSWYKVMKDGTPVISPVGNIFYLLDSAGELLFKDNTSGNNSAPRRAMNGDIVIGSNTFKDYVDNTANAYFPKNFAGKVSYRNDLAWHNKYDSTTTAYGTMEFYTAESGFSAVGGGDEIYLIFFEKLGDSTYYHKYQFHFTVKKEEVWYTDRDEINYINYRFDIEYWDMVDGSADDEPTKGSYYDMNNKYYHPYFRIYFSSASNVNYKGIKFCGYDSYSDYLNYGFTYNSNAFFNQFVGYNADLLSSITMSNVHFTKSLSTHDESCTYNGDCDFGYVASLTPITTTYKIDTSKIPDNYYVNVSGDTIYNYNITNPDTGQKSTVNEYITNNYTYITNPDDNNSGSGNSGGVGGNVTVGGQIDFGGKVDVDVNVNINGGVNGNGNSYEMPDTAFVDDWLDAALDESTGIRKFIKDFFSCLPSSISGLLCIGLTLSILLRIIKR